MCSASGGVCVRRRVCVFGGGRWCVSLARACAAHDRPDALDRPTRAPDRRRPPTQTADPHPAEVRGVHPSYSTRASRRVRAINLFYVPLYTQTSYCARRRPSRVARDGVRADDRGRGHARDATRSLERKDEVSFVDAYGLHYWYWLRRRIVQDVRSNTQSYGH